jgi:hypothetical protein
MSEKDWDENTEESFITRYNNYKTLLTDIPNVFPVEQYLVQNAVEAEAFFNQQITLEQEGMILRQPSAFYKHGRCTTNQDGMWKFKEFQTHDAVIVSVEEQQRLKPGVERTRDVLGHLERRFEQDLYEPAGKVGAFIVQHEHPVDPQGKGMPTLTFKVNPARGMMTISKPHGGRTTCNIPKNGTVVTLNTSSCRTEPKMRHASGAL